ncbi:hypothetical protein Pcinc_006156 [Petrolisthes cinctipes]|uniref:Uncharacterized protein n=1 Tax=Petrolisthes cinctipes TaxID=88211 RepID=A0AAE1GDJ7_PETCI|nr:hypothetical protein Pcinc_006156 [Petrolisthes cinctipes]
MECECRLFCGTVTRNSSYSPDSIIPCGTMALLQRLSLVYLVVTGVTLVTAAPVGPPSRLPRLVFHH